MAMRVVKFVIIYFILHVHYGNFLVVVEDENVSKTDLIDNLLKGYNKFTIPTKKKPLLVRLQFYILFYDISETSMDFALSYYIKMTWTDDRLSLKPEKYGNISYVILHPEEMQKIWKPDIFYINEKGESISKPPSTSQSASQLYPSGQVIFLRKLETKFQCQIHLQNYPFDAQICHVDIGSFAFTTDFLNIGFIEPSPVQFEIKVELTAFKLLEVETKNSNLTVEKKTYPRAKIFFKLKRYVNFYLLQVKLFYFSKDFISWHRLIQTNWSFAALRSQLSCCFFVMACFLNRNGGGQSGVVYSQ